ncbi:Nuclear transport factor 2 [Vanrija albida]|uniref:Nuclear transport factor 2 n=1 Tax=Vanrija albida TaxID=181172 RepID=A0ABR3Q6Z0_9TREE
MADINEIAKQREHSMLTWEDKQLQGTANIIQQLQGLPFAQVQHKVITRDAQPASDSVASILVLVTGQLLVDDGANVLSYSQMFHLVPDGGSYFVLNDVFRLVYG